MRQNFEELRSGKLKIRSAQASFAGGFVLLSNNQVFQFGLCGREFGRKRKPTRMNYEDVFTVLRSNEDICPLKLDCRWSRVISVCSLVCVDFRGLKEAKLTKDKLVDKLNEAWGPCDKQLLPPYDELTAKFINYKSLQKPQLAQKPNTAFSNFTQEIVASRLNNINKDLVNQIDQSFLVKSAYSFANGAEPNQPNASQLKPTAVGNAYLAQEQSRQSVTTPASKNSRARFHY